MLLLIIFLPLINSILYGLKGHLITKLFGPFFGPLLFLGNSFLCVILAIYNFIMFMHFHNTQTVFLINWIFSDSIYLKWNILFDALSNVMLVVVTGISFIIHFYTLDYMKNDPHFNRFISYLSLFTFFMILLVTADNFIQMFVGWEGVGVCSYFLINFWFTRIQANKAAIKAMLVNRVGDFGLIFGIFLIVTTAHTTNYSIIFSLAPYITNVNFYFLGTQFNVIESFTFFIFIGAIGKSAQIGLHAWLPDAMEGPTPVSALLHSATMVTAGVFLLIRLSPIIEYAPITLSFIAITGAITALFAATTGIFQNDLKRIIAYSTCSQLGYMIFSCGLSNYTTSFFHLFNHAFFKALLFLCAGVIIHSLGDEQDIRKMGGLKELLPLTYICMLLGSFALMGMPYLSGFYSKDLMLEYAYCSETPLGLFAFSIGCFSACGTAYYSIRILALVFLVSYNGARSLLPNVHEGSFILLGSLIVLVILSITSGFFFKDIFVGMGTTFWQTSIYTNLQHSALFESEFIPTYIKQIPLIFTFLGAFGFICLMIIIWLYPRYSKNTNLRLKIYNFFNRKWFLDKFFNNVVSSTILKSGKNDTFMLIDKTLIEAFGPTLITSVINKIIKIISILYYDRKSTFLLLFTLIFNYLLFTNIEIFVNDPTLQYKEYAIYILIFVLPIVLYTYIVLPKDGNNKTKR